MNYITKESKLKQLNKLIEEIKTTFLNIIKPTNYEYVIYINDLNVFESQIDIINQSKEIDNEMSKCFICDRICTKYDGCIIRNKVIHYGCIV